MKAIVICATAQHCCCESIYRRERSAVYVEQHERYVLYKILGTYANIGWVHKLRWRALSGVKARLSRCVVGNTILGARSNCEHA